MRFWKRLRRIGPVHGDGLNQAAEVTSESRRQAKADLQEQQELLKHERATVTDPLKDERVRVNHLAVLAQQALRGS